MTKIETLIGFVTGFLLGTLSIFLEAHEPTERIVIDLGRDWRTGGRQETLVEHEIGPYDARHWQPGDRVWQISARYAKPKCQIVSDRYQPEDPDLPEAHALAVGVVRYVDRRMWHGNVR